MIILDNIIFNLQNTGGISVVWSELIKRILHSDFAATFVEYGDKTTNLVRKQLEIPAHRILKKSNKFLRVQRYRDFQFKSTEKFIFHSSYYRICQNKNSINVVTVHDFTYEYYFPSIKKILHCRQKYKAIRKADYIICISENTKKDLLKFLPDIEGKNIRVIYNGVSDEYFKIDKNTFFSIKLPFREMTYFLYVGSRARYKNFELAVQITDILNQNLVIVGGGGLSKNELIFLRTKLGDNRYIYCDNVSNQELNILYNGAKSLLYLSKYEGFGIPILEAQKAGCPVICYNASSTPEVVGDYSLLVNDLTIKSILQKIQLLDDENSRNNIIAQGINNSNKFTWEQMYTEIIRLYSDILHETSTSPIL